MKLTANDTLLISSVKSDNILQGEQFEVSDEEGKRLIDAGYATKVAAKRAAAKKALAPANKMAQAPANKAGAGKKKAR